MSYTTSRRYCRSPRRIRQSEGREALASFSSLFVFVPPRSLFSRAICSRMRLTRTQKQASEEGSNKYRHPKQGSRITKHTRSSSGKSRFGAGSLLHGVEHLGKTVIPNSVPVVCRALSVWFCSRFSTNLNQLSFGFGFRCFVFFSPTISVLWRFCRSFSFEFGC